MRMMHISVIKLKLEERLFETETATTERELTMCASWEWTGIVITATVGIQGNIA